MKKIVLLLTIFLLLAPGLASAESGRELLENSARFNDNQVTFSGEVIGVLPRVDFAWVNISDNGYVIGVLCRASDAKKVSVIGDYKHVGDTVQVIGIFHMACPEHGGDLDIHADNFTVLVAGEEVDRPVSIPLVALSAVLIAVAIFVTFYLWRVRKEREKILPWPFH